MGRDRSLQRAGNRPRGLRRADWRTNTQAAHAAVASGMVGLHGGAVDIDGRAVAVVGHSGAGKSTLTAATLVMAGHPYLADELVAVDDDLTAHPFHRPIGLRPGGAAANGITIPTGPMVSAYPYRVGAGHRLSKAVELLLGLIVLLHRGSPESTECRVAPVAPSAALFGLCQETLGAYGLERPAFRRIDSLIRQVDVVELHYGETGEAVARIEVLMQSGRQ